MHFLIKIDNRELVADNIATDSGTGAVGGREGCPGVECKYVLHSKHAGGRKAGL
jgi:hypothetical protein